MFRSALAATGGISLDVCKEMKNRILVVISIIFAGVLGSYDDNEHASQDSSNDAGREVSTVGNKRCDVHQNECIEEGIEIMVMHGPSYPDSYWQVRHSEDYIEAKKSIFPNANSVQSYAVPGTSYAKEEGGKKIRRFYCSECREEEKQWHDRNNQ